MDHNKFLEQLLLTTYTKQEIVVKVRTLKTFLSAKIFGADNQLIDANELLFQNKWLESFDESFYNYFNKDTINPFFQNVENTLATLVPLIIYLPFDPDTQTKNRIGSYLRQQYGQYFLFDIKYDPTLIAGCALVWNGIYKDYSLKDSITAKKMEIITSFKQFIHTK